MEGFILTVALLFSYVALVSGFSLGSKSDNLLPLQLLVDLLTGQVGDEGQQESAASVVRVVIAGNSLSEHTQDKDSLHKVFNEKNN